MSQVSSDPPAPTESAQVNSPASDPTVQANAGSAANNLLLRLFASMAPPVPATQAEAVTVSSDPAPPAVLNNVQSEPTAHTNPSSVPDKPPVLVLQNSASSKPPQQAQPRDEQSEPSPQIKRDVATNKVAPQSQPRVLTGNPTAPQAPLPPSTGKIQVLALGDSVMLGAANYLHKTILDVYVDAKVGRQVSMAIRMLQERKAANMLPPTIIIHLGNNGTFSAGQFDEMMTLLSDAERVVFVNTKVPRKWQDPNNSALIEGVQRYPNAVLVDWNNISSSHADWFWKDGIHLRPEGAQVYAALIAQVLNEGNP